MLGDPYPPGSMRGSGIYQTEMLIDVECEDCFYKGEVEGVVNDYGTSGYWDCPQCSSAFDFDVSDYQDEEYYDE